MSEENQIDANKIATGVISELIKDVVAKNYETVTKYVSVKKTEFFENFTNYSNLQYQKSTSIKTLFSKNRAINIDTIYIPSHFSSSEDFRPIERVSEEELINKYSKGKRIVVKGNGGSGKTIFLKHLWRQRFTEENDRIPIFLELRRLSKAQSPDFESFCQSEISVNMVIEPDAFINLCQKGRFEFILDAFDEIGEENREIIENQILRFSEKFSNCPILVSGRHDDRFGSWSAFEIFDILPFRLQETKELVTKIPWDDSVKKSFIKSLNEDFFNQHESFLSSPLLATIMLMTFTENAVIPSKLTTFYESAYTALILSHDAQKESFVRERALKNEVFKKFFAVFCLMSYCEDRHEFTDFELDSYVTKAKNYHTINKENTEIIKDMCEAINLIQKDGLKYTFVHRSFQEYFAAVCVTQVTVTRPKKILEIFANKKHDSAFFMCYELHSELVYEHYLLEKIKELEKSPLLHSGSSGKAKRRRYMLHSFSLELTGHLNHVGFTRVTHFNHEDVTKEDWTGRGLEVLETCLMLEEKQTYEHLLFQKFSVLITNILADLKERNLFTPKAVVQISIIHEKNEIKISARNKGDNKLSYHRLKQIKTVSDKHIRKFIDELDEGLLRKRREILDFFNKLQTSKKGQQEAIDDLIGIPS